MGPFLFFMGVICGGQKFLILVTSKDITQITVFLQNTWICPKSLFTAPHTLGLSNPAMACPQLPCFCPGGAIKDIETVYIKNMLK